MDTILVLDYGSQYTQLIARRVRELQVYSIILPYNAPLEKIKELNPKGIILSGGPASVYEKKSPDFNKDLLTLKVPLLGICYGMQLLMKTLGGVVSHARSREYGRTQLMLDNHKDLFYTLPASLQVWMSHGDCVKKLPQGFVQYAHTPHTEYAAVGNPQAKIYGVQFHPEVAHTDKGTQILSNFVFRVCQCFAQWHLSDFVQEKVDAIRKAVPKSENVISGLSGGVDSSVSSVIVHKALGKRLKCIFVNNGLLRKDEEKGVVEVFRDSFSMDLHYVDASKLFLKALKGVDDPEKKRKIIGHLFIDVFEKEARKIKKVKYLVQGTLYPDVIESVSFFGGPTARIKSHHNVGGLPEDMKLKLIEPLRELFKDEVRKIGAILKIPAHIISRHPFPGPGLGVRIIGPIDAEKLRILREADAIVEEKIRKHDLYQNIWQAFAVLLPLRSVGVMGDQRTYEYTIALRCVTSVDGMTADWADIPKPVLEEISNTIINHVRGVNRVVYDISSKPPATIEWE